MGGWFGDSSQIDSSEMYGRHNRYRMFAVPVAVLLQKAIDEGRALRLDWRDDDPGRGDGFPTGVLPAVRAEQE